jgi:preprotein translocase subunit SecG
MLDMPWYVILLTVLQLLTALATILIVLFQSGKSAGLSGVIGGVADTFLAKNKAKTLDAKLAKNTKWVAIAFVVLTLLINILA